MIFIAILKPKAKINQLIFINDKIIKVQIDGKNKDTDQTNPIYVKIKNY